MRYDEVVDYIINIPRFAKGPGERNKSGNPNLKQIMERLGNPHLNVRSIHIAGTNGKGSTCQFVKNILNAKGYSVGVFTSPHLVKINERIEISYGKTNCSEDKFFTEYISDEEFVKCFDLVQEKINENIACGGLGLSFFEMMFAMAAVYFDMKKPDYVIYETGLGGRLDATNILAPVITAITSIGLDHTEYLGDTISEIAGEKAGIIKENTPVIYNTGSEKADKVIEDYAKKMGAKAINVAKTDYIINEFTHKTIDFSIYNSYYKYHNLMIPVGDALYQLDNAMTAITLCNCLFKDEGYLDYETIKLGLTHFKWQGRMERIHPNVVLDGAHNLDAIERFTESLSRLYGGREISLLFAVAGDKDYRPMIDALCESLNLSRVYVTSLNSKRGIKAEHIADIFKEYLGIHHKKDNCVVVYDDSIKDIFTQAYEAVKNTDETLFCVGSLYLIGSIKEMAKEVLND